MRLDDCASAVPLLASIGTIICRVANKRLSRIGPARPFSLPSYAKTQKFVQFRSLSRDQLHWQAGKLPQAVAEPALRFADDVDALNPRSERRHEHLDLEARQHLADAQMNAGPKAT